MSGLGGFLGGGGGGGGWGFGASLEGLYFVPLRLYLWVLGTLFEEP